MKEITCKVGGKMTVTLDKPIPMLGDINVKSSPTKAKIILDGKDTGKTTPDFLTDILEGTHKVRLEKQGCASVEQTVVVKENETANVEATLSEGKNVTIKSDTPNTRIYVNGDYVGEAPVTVKLSYEKVKIAAEGMGIKNEQTFDITENSADHIDMVVGAVTIKTHRYRFMDVNKTAQDNIYVDGKLLENNPTRLALGKHKITTMRPGGVKRSKTLRIKNNGDVTLDINTTRRNHWIGLEVIYAGKKSDTINYIENTTESVVNRSISSIGLIYDWNFCIWGIGKYDPKTSDIPEYTLGLSLNTGVYYKTATYEVSYKDAESISRTNKIEYSNIDIPLLLKASLGYDVFGLWVDAGPLWSLGISAKQQDGSIDDLQGIGGLYLRFDVGISIYCFTIGLTNVSPLTNQKLYNGDSPSYFGFNMSLRFDDRALLSILE